MDVFGRYSGHFALQMDIFIYEFGRYYGENLIITKWNLGEERRY